MADTDFVVAQETFATVLDGQAVIVHRGENVRVGHPLVMANPGKFKPLELSTRWDTVEQATAGPGEIRNVGRRHKRVGTTGMPRDPRGITDTNI